MPDQDPPLIDVSDLRYAPEGQAVLTDISLRSSARRIGIVGRNGSGKTSLARLLAGLVAPDQGTVRIAGVDVAQDRKAALSTIGILFQNPDHQIIFPTVEEELGFGLTQMGLDKAAVSKRVAEVLRGFDRASWSAAPIHQLSQGQRQLVCLMAVLAMAPKVILLDEPFAALDIPTAMQLARRLADVPQTVVQITHDPATIRDFDHVVWLDQGRIVSQGAAAEVLPDFEAAMRKAGGLDDLTHLTG